MLTQAGRNANSSGPVEADVVNQFNNFYSSLHPYYLYPEWLTFYRVHHFHHAQEHEPDYAKNAVSAPAKAQAAVGKQLSTAQEPAATAKAPAKPAPKQAQPLSSR